jgi:hypothetical protein
VILEEEANKNGVHFFIHQEQRFPNTMLQHWLLSQKKTRKRRVCSLAAEVASLLSGMGLEASLLNLIDIT